MFKPTITNDPAQRETERYIARTLKNALIVMNVQHFDKEKMHAFKNGVHFSVRINGAAVDTDFNDVKFCLDYIRKGSHSKYDHAFIHIDSDGRTRCYLRKRGIDAQNMTNYITVRDCKAVMVDF